MASSGSGQDSVDPVYAPLERDESNAAATAAAEPPPPPPASPVDVLQRPVHERPNDGGGSPSQVAAAAAADRKGKKVVVASSSSSSSSNSTPPASPASVSGGEESRVTDKKVDGGVLLKEQLVKVPKAVRRTDLKKKVFDDMLQNALSDLERQEAGDGKHVIPQTVWPNKDSSLRSKVKGGMKVLAGITRRMRSNQNSTPSAPQVTETVIHITDMIEYYELLAGEGKILNSNEQELRRAYSGFRPVLGDGECFYRSFIFSYLEQVLEREDTHEESRLLAAVKEVAILHASLGWNSNFSKSCKAFKKMIKKVKRWKRHSRWKRVPTTNSYRREKLLKLFSSYDATKHIFAFLRLVAAIWICSHQEEYTQRVPDLSDVYTLRHWCFEEVIPSRIDADHVQMTALVTALGVPLRVEDLLQGFGHPLYTGQGRQDRQDPEDPDVPRCTCRPRHRVPPDHEVPSVTVLYVNEHYDIIYRHRRDGLLPSGDEGCSSGTGPRPGEVSPSSSATSTGGYSPFWAICSSQIPEEGDLISNEDNSSGGLTSNEDQGAEDIAANANSIWSIPDLLWGIFTYLPLISVHRFRCVCSFWHALLTDDIFIKMHHNHWVSKIPIFLYRPSLASDSVEVANEGGTNLEAIDLVAGEVQQILRFIVPVEEDDPKIHGSCEGVIVLSYRELLCACNPETSNWGLLPPIHMENSIVAFYEGKDDQLCLLYRGNGQCSERSFAISIISGTLENSVRQIGLPILPGLSPKLAQMIRQLPPAHEGPPVMVAGILYWLLRLDICQGSGHPLLSFDICKEEFSFADPPPLQMIEYDAMQVFECEEKLGMAVMNADQTMFSVWVLQSRGNGKGGWSFNYRVLLPIAQVEYNHGMDLYSELILHIVSGQTDFLLWCPETLLHGRPGGVLMQHAHRAQWLICAPYLHKRCRRCNGFASMSKESEPPFFRFIGTGKIG